MPILQFYIEILKYASARDYTEPCSLVSYLNENQFNHSGYRSISLSDIVFKNIFESVFIDEFGNKADLESRNNFYLKPESLSYLINFESLEQIKKDSLKARKDAVDAMRIAARAINIAIGVMAIAIIVVICGAVLVIMKK